MFNLNLLLTLSIADSFATVRLIVLIAAVRSIDFSLFEEVSISFSQNLDDQYTVIARQAAALLAHVVHRTCRR